MSDVELIVNAIVNSFLERNPDLVKMIAKDCLMHDHLQPETIIAIGKRIAEASEFRNG